MSDEIKTPKELAKKEVNKRIAKMIAERQLEVKRHEAAIKKLEKEIEKIDSGELVPIEDSDESSDYDSEIKKLKEEIEILKNKPLDSTPYNPENYKKLYWVRSDKFPNWKKRTTNWTYTTTNTSGNYL